MNDSATNDDDCYFSEEEWEDLSEHDRFFADAPCAAETADDSQAEEAPEKAIRDISESPPNPFIGKHYTEPQTVFISNKRGIIAIAKSMLMSADIEFFVKGEYVADKFALGEIGNFNNITRGMSVIVRAKDAADAFEILSSLD